MTSTSPSQFNSFNDTMNLPQMITSFSQPQQRSHISPPLYNEYQVHHTSPPWLHSYTGPQHFNPVPMVDVHNGWSYNIGPPILRFPAPHTTFSPNVVPMTYWIPITPRTDMPSGMYYSHQTCPMSNGITLTFSRSSIIQYIWPDFPSAT